MEEPFPIAVSYNKQTYSNINCQRAVNMYEFVETNADATNAGTPNAMAPTSGLDNSNIIFTTDSVGFREQFVFVSNGVTNVYSVVGSGVYLSNDSLTATLLGRLPTTDGYVSIDANTFQIIFVDGISGFIYDTNANTFTRITDTNFPARPIDVCYLDGFFVVAAGQTNTFFLSSFNQGLVWGGSVDTFTADSTTDLLTMASTANYSTGISFTVSSTGTLAAPLLVATTYYSIRISNTTIKVAASYDDAINSVAINLATNGTPTQSIESDGILQQGAITAHPGTIVGCSTLHRRLFLFSQCFTEVWENAGTGTALPFRRNNSLLIEFGTPSIGSVRTGFDMMFFLSQDQDGLGPVMRIAGTQAIPVSTTAIDSAFAELARGQMIDDCKGILMREDGIIFYRLNFTTANHTFVYNQTMSSDTTHRWHEEDVLNGDRHPAQTHVFFQGSNYYGDYNRPILYRVNPQSSTNNGEAIKRVIIQCIKTKNYVRRRIDRLFLLLRQGHQEVPGTVILEAPLLTEDGEYILTEDGEILLSNQPFVVPTPNLLNPDGSMIHPVVFLSMSKNSGESFTRRVKATMGNLGEYTWRTMWRKLGVVPKGQNLVVRFEFFNKIPFLAIGASWNYEIMPE